MTKVYFPRVLLPLAAVIVPSSTSSIGFVVLVGMMVFYGIWPTGIVWLLAPLFLLAFVTALGLGLCSPR